MSKLGGTVSPHGARIKAWLRGVAVWMACGCAYLIAVFCVWSLNHYRLESEACRNLPPVPRPDPVMLKPQPLIDTRVQCLAAIMAKSDEKRWDLIELELADSKAVCFVAEGIYPRAIVPETTKLPAKAVARAKRAVHGQ